MATPLETLLQKFEQQQESAKAANLQRYQDAMKIYDEIVERYRPGGEFGAGYERQIEQRKVRDVGRETQQLISSGLYGTTTMGATGRRWEESVGTPERLRLEDIKTQRLSEAQRGKAEFIERREDVGPDYATIAQLASQIGQSAGISGGGFGGAGRTTKAGDRPDPSWYMGGATSYTGLSSTQRSGLGDSVTGGGGGMSPVSAGALQGKLDWETLTGGGDDTVMQKATAAYTADVQRVVSEQNERGLETSMPDITVESYQKLLSQTPRNPSRGVWKAYIGAGGK